MRTPLPTNRSLGLAFLIPMCVVLLLGSASVAVAQHTEIVTRKVKAGDTLQLLAAEYYGDRRHAVFILVANKMQHERPLRAGETLKVPVGKHVVVKVGQDLGDLAQLYLGNPKRAYFLAMANHLPDKASLAAGEEIYIPFHVIHRAATKETLSDIAASYFMDKGKGALLQRYNFLDRDLLTPGETIVVPISHIRVRKSKLPPPDEKSTARQFKHRRMQEKAKQTLPMARSAWDNGDYAVVKRALTKVDLAFVDHSMAVESGILLGRAYIAFGDVDSALAIFKKVRERDPNYTLSPLEYSPKVLSVWQKANGAISVPRKPVRPR